MPSSIVPSRIVPSAAAPVPAAARSTASRVAVVAAAAALVGVAACGAPADDRDLPLTGLVLSADRLPPGFTAAPMELGDLIAANRRALDQAETVSFTPSSCAPTADAAFNPALTEENSALLVGRSDDGTFSELVSTVVRDVDADRRATTGPCAVVTATPTVGALAGARIVTTTVELPTLRRDGVEQAFLTRSESVTALADGHVRARAGLMGNALVRRSGGGTVTVQVSLSTMDGEASAEVDGVPGAVVSAPVSDADFVRLMGEATARAAR